MNGLFYIWKKKDRCTIMQMAIYVTFVCQDWEGFVRRGIRLQYCCQLFIDDGMEPHSEKFQFMVISNNDIDTHISQPNDTTKSISQSYVVLLGIKIILKRIFTKHACAFCTKVSKQLNVSNGISNFVSCDSKKMVNNGKFQYSPLYGILWTC